MNNLSFKKIADQIQSKNSKTLYLFDLDSTLYNVSPRTKKIVNDFCLQEPIQNKYPNESAIAQKISIKAIDWGFQESFEREDFVGSINFLKKLSQFWRLHFFSSTYLLVDQLYPEALNLLKFIHANEGAIAYLTGRHETTMKKGTLDSFKQYNIPLSQEKDLIMKSEKNMVDSSFKLEEILNLQKTFDQIIFFENEPVIINAIEKNTTNVPCIFVNSTHSRKESVRTDILQLNMDFSPITSFLRK